MKNKTQISPKKQLASYTRIVGKLIGLITLACFIGLSNAHAFEIMVSLNTYKQSKITDAINKVEELKADGAWFIYGNSDFSDSEWGTILNKLPGKHYTEDIVQNNNAYNKYSFVMGKKPTGAMWYIEPAVETPGGTVLSSTQIGNKYAATGNNKIMTMCRAYVGDWKTEVDRCLNDSRVNGIICEPVKDAITEKTPGIHNGIPQLMDACQDKGKKLIFLLHAGPDGWSDGDWNTLLSKLNGWNSNFFKSDNVTLVIQNYDTQGSNSQNTTSDWFGNSGSVRSAMLIGMDHAAYSGAGNSSGNTGNPIVHIGPMGAFEQKITVSKITVGL